MNTIDRKIVRIGAKTSICAKYLRPKYSKPDGEYTKIVDVKYDRKVVRRMKPVNIKWIIELKKRPDTMLFASICYKCGNSSKLIFVDKWCGWLSNLPRGACALDAIHFAEGENNKVIRTRITFNKVGLHIISVGTHILKYYSPKEGGGTYQLRYVPDVWINLPIIVVF